MAVSNASMMMRLNMGCSSPASNRQARARLDCGLKDISGSLAGEINRILRIQG